MNQKILFMVIVVLVVVPNQVVAQDSVRVSKYKIEKSSNSDYKITVLLETNATITSVTMIVGGSSYAMKEDTHQNTFFTTLSSDIHGQEVELQIITTQGLKYVYFQVSDQNNNQNPLNIILSVLFFVVLLVLLVKYVVLYNQKG